MVKPMSSTMVVVAPTVVGDIEKVFLEIVQGVSTVTVTPDETASI